MTVWTQHRHSKRVTTLLNIAQLAYAHWFFGNLYEAVVRVPDHLANNNQVEDRRLASMLSTGSPLRYYLPGLGVVIGAPLAALVTGWSCRPDRPWLAAVVLSTLAGVAATAYLVRAVNLKLFLAGPFVHPDERHRLLRTWYRLNALRLLTTASAWLIAARLASR